MIDRLIVGLGNPGPKYALTRHNIGFLFVDYFAQSLEAPSWSEKFSGLFFEVKSPWGKLGLLKPQTFMNLSGRSVLEALNFYKLDLQQLIVCHDEVDIAFGFLKFQTDRSAAGNNGIKSLIECLGSQKFDRLRMGVGRPPHPEFKVADYVLQKFSNDEMKELPVFFQKAGEGIQLYLKSGLNAAASEFNTRSLI